MSTTKPIVFTPSSPLVIRIHKDAGFWDIEPSPGHKPAMNSRATSDLPNINSEYQGRRAGGAPPLPRFKMDLGHTPIVMREGESVKFVCDPPFAFSIWADRDANVGVIQGAPGTPFVGWIGPQPVAPGASSSLPATVKMPAGGIGPRDQRFYKITAWVYDETPGQPPETVTIDPDGYCDR